MCCVVRECLWKSAFDQKTKEVFVLVAHSTAVQEAKTLV